MARSSSTTPRSSGCLTLFGPPAKDCGEPVPEAYQPFNLKTHDGRDMQLYSDLLSRAIRSIADSKEEKDLDTLFTGPKTTALVNPVAGLDDFELIAFLIVQDAAVAISEVQGG